jgi:hypothetical protein
LAGKTSETSAGVEDSQIFPPAREQSVQNHGTPILRKKLRERPPGFLKNELGKSLERKDLQPGITGSFAKYLPFQLESRLFWRKQDKWRASRVVS